MDAGVALPVLPSYLDDCDLEGEFADEDLSPPTPDLQPPPKFGKIIQDTFGFYIENSTGEYNGDPADRDIKDVVRRYTITNTNGVSVQIINYGATITSIVCPDKNGVLEDVVLGFETIEDYRSSKNQYFGATIGRVAGIIPNGLFHTGDTPNYLTNNLDGCHHFNGGKKAFDKVLWDSHVNKEKVVMSYCDDAREGHPGQVMTQIMYHLTWDNRLVIEISATVSLPTPISITNHSYFNLAGHGAGPNGLKDHCMVINADRYVVADIDNKIPTGELRDVARTYFDFRVPRSMGKALARVPGGGYDDTFCLTRIKKNEDVAFAARLIHPDSGRYLEVFTNSLGLHVYTADRLPDPDMPSTTATTSKRVSAHLASQSDQGPMLEYGMGAVYWPRQNPLNECMLCDRLSWLGGEVPEAMTANKECPIWEESLSEFKNELRKSLMYEPIDVEPYLNACEEFMQKLRDDAESDVEEEDIPCWKPPEEIDGKMGLKYRNQCAICLMPQEYPNAINEKKFPSPIVFPGEKYSRTIVFKFGTVHPRKPQTPIKKPVESTYFVGEEEEEQEEFMELFL